MDKLGHGTFRLLEHLLVAGMLLMGLMVFGNVVLRYLFNSGIELSEEVSRFVFVWITFLGSVVALRKGIHLGIDTVVRLLPDFAQKMCFWISQLLMLWCCWLLWQGSWTQTVLNWYNVAPISGIPVAMMYASGLVAAFFMATIVLHNLWISVRGRRHPAADTGAEAAMPLSTAAEGGKK